MRPLALWLIFVCVFGCARQEEPFEPGPEPPRSTTGSEPDVADTEDPDYPAYLQYKEGMTRLQNAVGDIGDALRALDDYKSEEAAEALDMIREMVDDAGLRLSEHVENPPGFEQFERRYAEYDENRLRVIQDANDAIYSLSEARGIAISLAEEVDPAYEELADSLTVAIVQVQGGVEALGGEPL